MKNSISTGCTSSPTLSRNLINKLSEIQENLHSSHILTDFSVHPFTLAVVLPFSVTHSTPTA